MKIMTPEEIIIKILELKGNLTKENHSNTMKICEAIDCIKLAQQLENSSNEIPYVSDQRELLIAFFLHFRNKGEQNIGMTIEAFVEDYLSNLPNDMHDISDKEEIVAPSWIDEHNIKL